VSSILRRYRVKAASDPEHSGIVCFTEGAEHGMCSGFPAPINLG
jgi:hypothetical protein